MTPASRRSIVVRCLRACVFVALCAVASVARAQDGASADSSALAGVDSLAIAVPDSAASAAPASPNARPMIGAKLVQLTGKGENGVRSGPGNTYAIVGTYPREPRFPVIAKSGPWYDVRLADSETGCVHTSLGT